MLTKTSMSWEDETGGNYFCLWCLCGKAIRGPKRNLPSFLPWNLRPTTLKSWNDWYYEFKKFCALSLFAEKNNFLWFTPLYTSFLIFIKPFRILSITEFSRFFNCYIHRWKQHSFLQWAKCSLLKYRIPLKTPSVINWQRVNILPCTTLINDNDTKEMIEKLSLLKEQFSTFQEETLFFLRESKTTSFRISCIPIRE